MKQYWVRNYPKQPDTSLLRLRGFSAAARGKVTLMGAYEYRLNYLPMLKIIKPRK